MKPVHIICIGVLIFVVILIFRCEQKDGFQKNTCPYPPWPSSTDCGGYIKYFSNGYPTIVERGNQANNMNDGDGWWGVCSDDQMNIVFLNSLAYCDSLNPGMELDVKTVVLAILGTQNQNPLTNKQLCQIARIITTPPTNPCQLEDWKNNYMSSMDQSTQTTLNKWLSYGC